MPIMDSGERRRFSTGAVRDIADGKGRCDLLPLDVVGAITNDPIKQAIRIGAKQKIHCLTARGYNQSHSGMVLITDGTRYRYLTNNEAELAMTLPFDYTAGIPDKERAKCVGNCWTVDVAAHIFTGLRGENND